MSISDEEMQQARALWQRTYGDAPVERLISMMGSAMMLLHDDKCAAQALIAMKEMGVERLRAMAELTIAFVRETLEARGYELEVTMAPNNETLQ
jgi:hypothetical protein